MRRTPKFNPRRMNAYVPAMAYSADVIHGGPHEVRFGPVANGMANNILNGLSIAAAGESTTFLQDNTDPPLPLSAFPVGHPHQSEFPYGPGFGRCLSMVASGTASVVVNVYGTDYLGQPMMEAFTLNGTTPVVGNKAFKYIDRVQWPVGAAVTINLGTNNKLGLPYATENVLTEQSNFQRVASVGTFQLHHLQDQTATTNDPRGAYTPTTTLNGSNFISIDIVPYNSLNNAGNGGLFGLRHFGG